MLRLDILQHEIFNVRVNIEGIGVAIDGFLLMLRPLFDMVCCYLLLSDVDGLKKKGTAHNVRWFCATGVTIFT